MSDLPEGWAETTLGMVADWGSGGTPKAGTAAYYGGSIPWAVIGDLTDGAVHKTAGSITELGLCNSSAKLVGTDVVLVAMYGSIGKLGLPAIPMATNQAIAFAQPHPKILIREYLFYYLMHARRRLAAAGKGATQQNISQTVLKAWPILIAPLPEQKRIVAAIEEQFSRLDAGAAVLERVRHNLKRMRAAVLHVGVTGRLVDQEPREGSGADLLASIKLDGRRTSRKSENLTTRMPQLPQSWTTARWSAVGWSQNGRAFPSADYTKAGVRLLRPGNLYASGQVDWTAVNMRCLPEHYASEFPSYLVGPNEIVMNLTAQSLKDEFLGRVCMTGPQDQPVLLNQRIARLTPVGMNPRFVFYVLKSPLFRRFVDQLNTGSLIQHMFTSQLDQFLLPIPPRGEQDRIVERIEQDLASLDYVEHMASGIGKKVPALKAAILSAAFSGKLVPQDPDDEPASALVERIESERASSNVHKRGRARKSPLLREEVTA